MPIDLTHWPLTGDVQELITTAGFWPANSSEQTAAVAQVAIAIPAAVADFEKQTGWLPFLAGTTDETRRFDATDDTGLLNLHSGLVNVTSLTVGGQSYLQNSDFWLRRSLGAGASFPFDLVQFAGRVWHSRSQPDQISITGRWGYCATLPADVWEAIRQGAAALTVLNLTTASQAVIRTVTEDTFRQSFDLGVKRAERIQDWIDRFKTTTEHYKRVVL